MSQPGSNYTEYPTTTLCLMIAFNQAALTDPDREAVGGLSRADLEIRQELRRRETQACDADSVRVG